MNQEKMNIQWYPGHMTKTRRQIEADLKLVDAVCEIVDARIPMSSRNPDIDSICGAKPRMIILNRIDMADPEMVRVWTDYFKSRGMAVIQTVPFNAVKPVIRALCSNAPFSTETAAPFSRRYRMVGRAETMRLSSVMAPVVIS